MVNPGADPTAVDIRLNGLTQVAAQGKATVLASASLNDVNTMTDPDKVSPVNSTFGDAAAQFAHTFAPHSVTVLRIQGQ